MKMLILNKNQHIISLIQVCSVCQGLFGRQLVFFLDNHWNDDIPDGGIKTKNKTNNSDCELNDTLYSSTTMAPYDQWRRYDSAFT